MDSGLCGEDFTQPGPYPSPGLTYADFRRLTDTVDVTTGAMDFHDPNLTGFPVDFDLSFAEQDHLHGQFMEANVHQQTAMLSNNTQADNQDESAMRLHLTPAETQAHLDWPAVYEPKAKGNMNFHTGFPHDFQYIGTPPTTTFESHSASVATGIERTPSMHSNATIYQMPMDQHSTTYQAAEMVPVQISSTNLLSVPSMSRTSTNSRQGNGSDNGKSKTIAAKPQSAASPVSFVESRDQDVEEVRIGTDVDLIRDHFAWYKAKPAADGLYHCPMSTDQKEPCAHPATKLKCNYDKYCDAHLKPHRCKNPECKDLRFSSTACKLRHEREAHGSHGHGMNPFPCKFPDCERATRGFPRAWNRKDHMRRVHDYSSDEDDDDEEKGEEYRVVTISTEAEKSPKLAEKGASRKRAASVSAKATGPSKKARKTEVNSKPAEVPMPTVQSEHQRLQQLVQQQQDQWRAQWTEVHRTLQSIKGPLAIDMVQQLRHSVDVLEHFSLEIINSSHQLSGLFDTSHS